MHPQVQSEGPGTCPICGMELEKIKSPFEAKAVSLNTLLKPANQQVIANVPMIHMMERSENIEMAAYGFVNYDSRHVGVVSSNFSGRIDRLYVKYRYQTIRKGQLIMDVYSPEIVTAEEDLLFLLKNDPSNNMLINAAKEKLYLLGMSDEQLDGIIRGGKPAYRISLFSKYNGHIHESNSTGMNNTVAPEMPVSPSLTEALSMKEGMYIQKGQNIFSVFDPNRAWVLLNIFPDQVSMIKLGDQVHIVPESNPNSDFKAKIDYIEPVYRAGNKTLTVRVYFDNTKLIIPIGSQVSATIFAGNRSAEWLPEEAVLSLGLDKVVFVRTGESFKARKIATGISNKHLVQVLGGLNKTEAVAANAQFLVDSESFIKTN
ncbi:MAG: efflux RND transporter periplasmic adaptor subunit [Bacteroidetes bacterium]|nr:efflux RND transporter periplasmic adaptor subunit [Bacteroidota bacterium]